MRSGNWVLRHGSLFSGIGGFDLAAEWMGWTNVFHCELNPFCQRILKYYYPQALSYEDIKKTDFSRHKGQIDILTGGFPCQPYSVAGKRLGKEDERHLWPDMLRAVRQIRPTWVVGENVLGIVSWDGGMVFEEVQLDLEAQGYEVQPFVLPAAGVNAPHRRDRVWFVAYSNGNGGSHKEHYGEELQQKERQPGDCGNNGIAADSNSPGLQKTWAEQQAAGNKQRGKLAEVITHAGNIGRDDRSDNREKRCVQSDKRATSEDQSERERRKRGISKAGEVAVHAGNSAAQNKRPKPADLGKENKGWKTGRSEHAALQDHWANWPTQSPICTGNDGLSHQLDGITFPKWRTESIKAGGNAIVPQVAYQIFRAIQLTIHEYSKL
jgi:DNA (cytosine-5)-methyltransferase 1